MTHNLLNRFANLLMAVALAATGIGTAMAVPAYPEPLTMNQPDGTAITVRLIGDERGHYYTNLNGDILLETSTGFRYAELASDGSVQPGELVSDGRRSSAGSNVQARLRSIMQQRLASAPAKHPYVNKSFDTDQPRTASSGMQPPTVPLPGLFPGSDFPTIGSPKVLVILVEFLDVRFSSNTAGETLRKQIAQRHYTDRDFTGSAYDYYCDASMEQFTPQFDVMGPVMVPGTQATYGANDNYGNDVGAREMVIQACNMLKMQVDFSQYDNNNDGYVDNIYIIYAGRGEASGGGANTIWPHSWGIPEEMSPVYNGVKLGSYACSNELMAYSWGLDFDGIGTFCHEFGHVLGLPDLYSTHYVAQNHPAGWALMASGSYSNNSRTPPTLAAWERSALGWLKPIILQSGGDYNLPASLLTTNQAYVIPTRNPNEYFTLENRQQYRGDWDNYVLSWGMLVWHIDYNPSIWNSNIVNDNPNHQYANIVEAHGNDLNPVDHMKDCFPTFGFHSFTDQTKPALKAWDGSLTDITLDNITEDDEWNEETEEEPTHDVFFTANSRLGVETISADNGLEIRTTGLQVEAISASFATLLYLYRPDGALVASGVNTVTAPTPGLYILKADNTAVKLLLKQ